METKESKMAYEVQFLVCFSSADVRTYICRVNSYSNIEFSHCPAWELISMFIDKATKNSLISPPPPRELIDVKHSRGELITERA